MYATRIRLTIAEHSADTPTDEQVRQVECWMRSEFGTLDGLSADDFGVAVLDAWELVVHHPTESAALAATY